MSVAARIEEKLTANLHPTHITVTDESSLHEGHAGARPGGESHFAVYMVAEAFNGLPRVRRHQWVYRILAEELQGPVHALALTTLTPEEYSK